MVEVPKMSGFTSRLTKICFELGEGKDALTIYHPDGKPFIGFVENQERAVAAERHAQAAEQRMQVVEQFARDAEHRLQAAERQAQAEHDRAETLTAKLRALGIDPEA